VISVVRHNDLRRHDLTPAEVAARTGLSVPTLHYYEREGLIDSRRTSGNQRRYHRDVLRRLAFIRVSQRVGISLADIREALSGLPADRTPNAQDWSRLSRRWRDDLDDRMQRLGKLRDTLDGCIGCGCLSLRSCSLYNPDDELATDGTGAVRWESRQGRAASREALD
jgi:MerR family redox-sensitive transcriptional activator SoxR